MTWRSSLSAEEAVAWGAGPAPFRVSYTESRAAALPRIEQVPYHRWQLPSGETWITFHRAPDGYILCFPDLAQFRISGQARQVHCDAMPQVEPETLRQLLQQILPLVANGQRATMLHAGAVQVGGRAIAFMGRTGLGKSTLTAAFASQGCRFLCDDALQISLSDEGRPVAAPGQPHLRLWNDSAHALAGVRGEPEAKSRIPAGRRFAHCTEEQSLAAIYLLGESESTAPSFDPVRPTDALLELVGNSFLLDPQSPELLRVQHERLAAVAARVPVFRLAYARRYDSLPQVCRETAAHALSL